MIKELFSKGKFARVAALVRNSMHYDSLPSPEKQALANRLRILNEQSSIPTRAVSARDIAKMDEMLKKADEEPNKLSIW